MIKVINLRSESIYSGGRKTATARVKLVPGSGTNIFVNGKPASIYFQNNAIYLQNFVTTTEIVKTEAHYDAHISVEGGGLSAQAQAIRLALSKAYVKIFPEFRTAFKKLGFLTRDARIKERRKYGLKKARKAPQFSKR
jgi:small subunit ribosomal protein S9